MKQQLGTVDSVPSFFLFDTRGCTFRCTYTTSAAAGHSARRPPIHSVTGSIVSRGGSPSRRMAADGARGAGPAGVDRRAPRRAALGTEPPHLALAHGAVAHVLEKEGRIRAPCDGTLRRERRARAPVSRGRGAGALSGPAAAEALRASGRSRGMTQRMDAIRGKPFSASHGPCPTNVPVVPSVSHYLNPVVGHEHEF